MDIVRIVVLLLHPLLATGLLGWIWWQYSWRKKSHELKGESRKKALTQHETYGNRLIWSAFFVICVAFLSRAFVGWRENESIPRSLIPQSLHGLWDRLDLCCCSYLRVWGGVPVMPEMKVESLPIMP